MKMQIKIGDKYGELVITSEQYMKPVGKSKQSFIDCKCSCGTEFTIRTQELKKRTKCVECGKTKYERSPEQRLNPTGKEEIRDVPFIECKCECGQIVWIRKTNYTTNKTKSCGCLNQDKRKGRVGDKNGGFKHGLAGHPLRLIYGNIKTKCYNKNNELYHGGNIEMCEEWKNDFKIYYDWCIEHEWNEDKCISRKDFNLNYCPENCIITTQEEVSNREDVKERVHTAQRASLIEKYGVEYARDIPGVDEKIRKTCQEKYGADTPLGNKDIQQKAWNTNIEKYGQRTVPWELIKDKTIKTNLEKYGTEYPSQNEEVRKKQVDTKIDRGLIYIHDGLKAEDWAKKIGVCAVTMRNRIRQVGFEEAIKIPKRQTGIEYKIQQVLEKNNIEYIFSKKLGDVYPDFRIDSHSLVIESDGIYFHSDAVNKDRNYHSKKKKKYKELGYDSLFFRENEIHTKIDIIESIIKNKLGLITNRIFARKTKIQVVEKEEANIFFNENHLMGRGAGKTYGLFYENKLVCAMRIKKVRDYIDISRFCNIKDTNVVGGFTKLLKQIEKIYKKDIHTFIDMRYGDGGYLSKLGFEKVRENISFKWVNDDKVLGRQTFKGNSGYEHKYYKLWDCGQVLWVKKYPAMPGTDFMSS